VKKLSLLIEFPHDHWKLQRSMDVDAKALETALAAVCKAEA
jgi:hypothetical protein